MNLHVFPHSTAHRMISLNFSTRVVAKTTSQTSSDNKMFCISMKEIKFDFSRDVGFSADNRILYSLERAVDTAGVDSLMSTVAKGDVILCDPTQNLKVLYFFGFFGQFVGSDLNSRKQISLFHTAKNKISLTQQTISNEKHLNLILQIGSIQEMFDLDRIQRVEFNENGVKDIPEQGQFTIMV
jgi:hypothetical protein